MGPIADHDLGKAHGKIVIDYDDKGAKQAQKDMGGVEKVGQRLISMFRSLRTHLGQQSQGFGETAVQMSRTFAIMSGGTAILLGISRGLGSVSGRMFALKGGLGILGALGIGLGGLPKNVQGFPNVIKQIIILSSAITLFAGSSKLLNSVFVSLGRFVGSTSIVRSLAASFPQLTSRIGALAKHIPSIRQIGEGVDRIGTPIHKIARLALFMGALISTVRSGVKIANALAKGMAKIGLAANAIILVTKVIAGLISALKDLSGVVGLLPGLLAMAGVGFAAVKIGMMGFSDALKNMDDLEKFEESLKNLAPAAADTARAIKSLKPEFDKMRRVVQENLFAGLANEVRNLGMLWLPILQNALSLVTAEVNGVIVEFSRWAQLNSTISGFNIIAMNTAKVINNIKMALAPLLMAFLTLSAVSSGVIADMSGGLAGLTVRFNDFIQSAAESGKLEQWIRNGIRALQDLGTIIVNIGKMFTMVFQAFGIEGDGALAKLANLTNAMVAFLQSAEGQQALQALADMLKLIGGISQDVLMAALKALAPILVALKPFVEQLSEAFGGTLLLAIQILGPILLDMAKTLSFLAPVIAPILGAFLGLGIAGKALMFIFGPIATGIKLIVAGFTILRGAISAITTAWKILQFVFAVSPWTVIIAAIILLVILIVMNWDKIKVYLAAAWDWIKRTAETVWNSIVQFFTGIWDSVKRGVETAWNWVSDFFKAYWPFIVGIMTGGVGLIPALIIKYWDQIKQWTTDVWNSITSWLTGVWQNIVDSTRWIWEPIVAIFTSIFNILKDTIVIIVGATAIAWNFIWGGIRDFFVSLWTYVVIWFNTKLAEFVAAYHGLVDPIVAWWNGLWQGISDWFTGVWNYVVNWFNIKLAEFVAAYHGLVDPIVVWWNNLWQGIGDFFTGLWNGIVGWFELRIAYFLYLWHKYVDPIIGWWNNLWSDIWGTITRVGGQVLDWITSLPGRIWNAISGRLNILVDAGRQIIEGFLNGLRNAFKKVEDFVGGIADWIRANKGPLPYDRRLLSPAGVAIMQGLLGGLQSQRSTIVGFLQSLTGDIANGIDATAAKVNAASASLSSSTNVGVMAAAATGLTDPATAASVLTAPATTLPDAPTATGTGDTYIDKVEVVLPSNLDPTDPIAWKKAMAAISDGIRQHERERK